MSNVFTTGAMDVRQPDGSFKPTHVLIGNTKESIDAVNAKKEESIAAVNAIKQETLTEINRVKETIPEDYSQLSSSIVEISNEMWGSDYSVNLCDGAEELNGLLYSTSSHKFTGSNNAKGIVIPVNKAGTYTFEKVSGARLVLLTSTERPASQIDYNAVISVKTETKASINVTENDRYILFLFYNTTSDTIPYDEMKESLTGYYGTEWKDKKVQLASSEYVDKYNPMHWAVNTLSYKPLGNLTKPYILLSCDDGATQLATYTIPMLKSKNVPCTFGLMSNSAIFSTPEYENLVKEMVSDYGCTVAQHGNTSYTAYADMELLDFFDAEKTFFNEHEIELHGCICPNHSISKNVSMIGGGYHGSVLTGGGNTFITYGKYCESARSNMYQLCRTSVASYTLDQLKERIDYAKANNYLILPFWHDQSVDHTILEGMIDYAKTVGMNFITTKDLQKII